MPVCNLYVRAFRRRQNVHASGARFRTRPTDGTSLAAAVAVGALLPSMGRKKPSTVTTNVDLERREGGS